MQCIKTIQESIRNNDYDSILLSLRKLSSELTMSNDEHLSNLPIDILTDSLIYSLSIPDSPEMSLQSIVCINFLLESHHNALLSFVKAGVISHLTSRLVNIEYIDVAESAVKALEKISSDFPIEVLREGFLVEIFGVIDFFEQQVQKRILGIVLNTSRAIPTQEDFITYIAPSIPTILNLLQNRGREFLHQNEKSIEILTGLNESMRVIGSEETLSAILAEQRLIPLLFTTIQEMPGITIKTLKLFAIMCRNSLKLTLDFTTNGIAVIKNVVEKGINEGSYSIITESLQLINSIIPNENDLNSSRSQFFLENLEYIHQVADFIIPQLSSIYEIITKKSMKILFLDIIQSIIRMSNPDIISKYSQYSHFLSGLLVDKDSTILKSSLRIITILYDKIPEQISTSFIREGVVQRFKALKHPENLKNVIEDKYTDPLEFEHFLVNYRRSRAYSEHQDIHSSHSRPRLLSECRDNNYDQKKEIISLSKSLIDKHNACHNRSALSTVKTLKNIASLFEKNDVDIADEI